ncbi:MAG: glycosyltransferase [Endomicrobia bacterium]|nr:glycosyltransferase [Endomicrobiia bacterium]MCL2506719.1 glycosyltransferase [Endomicrobiia bacterium]
MKKVSVLISVYNAGRHIKESLDSVLSQTLKDIEIIIVDSASTDSTSDIIKDYIKKYPQIEIKYLPSDKVNTIAESRSRSLKAASGKYVAFIDSDDSINPEYLEKLYLKAEGGDYDVVFSSRYNRRDSGKEIFYKVWDYNGDNLLITPENRKEVLNKTYLHAVVIWGRIIKRSFLSENNITFFDSLRASEDLAFTMLSFVYARKIAYEKDAAYYYRTDSKNSFTKKLFPMVLGMIKGLAELRAELDKRNIPHKDIVAAVCVPASDILVGYFNKWNTGLASRLSVKELKDLFVHIKESSALLLPKELLSENRSKIFKIKNNLFLFAMKHNAGFIPKITRINRNLLKIFYPSK